MGSSDGPKRERPVPVTRTGRFLVGDDFPKEIGKEEEVGEAHNAVAVQVEAGAGCAEGACEEEEIGEVHNAVAIEVRAAHQERVCAAEGERDAAKGRLQRDAGYSAA